MVVNGACSLGDRVYVFCNKSVDRNAINDLTNAGSASKAMWWWQHFETPKDFLSQRYRSVIVPLNEKELIILGGKDLRSIGA